MLVLDANNDQAPDLFGISATTGARLFWINPKTSGNWTTYAACLLFFNLSLSLSQSRVLIELTTIASTI